MQIATKSQIDMINSKAVGNASGLAGANTTSLTADDKTSLNSCAAAAGKTWCVRANEAIQIAA